MSSQLFEKLGQVLVASLWQGAIFGAVLMVLLLVVRQAQWRYALSCLTLFAMLAWFVVSAVNVLLPPRDSTLTQIPIVENPYVPALETLTESVITTTSQPPDIAANTPTSNQSDATRVTPKPEARVILPRFNLQTLLPYVSLLWMIGVAVLSLRLLIGFYLLRRYKKESFELSESWIKERLQTLIKRMNLKQHVKLLQTNTLTTPAVMGVVKPILLIPSSLVSGLSVQQLDMLLAHELAHIQRRDYLVNILQTLAETLLFYHPVVWWVSRVIRQEREHCCDDVVLQMTGQSAVEYAEVLLRLEKSRQSLMLAANGGTLFKRIERLLGPSRILTELQSGLTALIMVSVLSLILASNIVRAQTTQVSQVPYVVNADIAVDPTNPNRLAIAVNQTSSKNCRLYSCFYNALLYTSEDNGKTWQEQVVYKGIADEVKWDTTFDYQGKLYTTLTSNDLDSVILNSSNTTKLKMGGRVTLDESTYQPELTVDPNTGTLYMVSLKYDMVNGYFSAGTPQFQTSKDEGKTWTEPISITQDKIWEKTGGYLLRAQMFIGADQNLTVVWFQDDHLIFEETSDGMVIYSDPESLPSVWMVSSVDGGKTFTEPQKIGAGSWEFNFINNPSGMYYVTSKLSTGNQQTSELSLMKSNDQGETWTSFNISPKLASLSWLTPTLPVIDVADNGIIDILYYDLDQPCEYNETDAIKATFVNPCVYNVYHIYSKDDGQTFSVPMKLNQYPIVGAEFVRIYGNSTPGRISVASTVDAAYPVWIGNREGVEGTQAYMMKIER